MSDLDPRLQAALRALAIDLKTAGYSEAECDALVEGAAESAALLLETNPDASVDDALMKVREFHDPPLAPEAAKGDPQAARFALFAWASLGATIAGLLVGAPLFSAFGGDGGAVMSMFALVGLPLSGLFAYFGRRVPAGRQAGVGVLVLAGVLAMIFAAAVLM